MRTADSYRTVLGDKIPIDTLGAAELGHCFVRGLLLKEIEQLLDEMISPDKISAVVAPDETRLAPSGNEPSQTGQERIGVRSATASKSTALQRATTIGLRGEPCLM